MSIFFLSLTIGDCGKLSPRDREMRTNGARVDRRIDHDRGRSVEADAQIEAGCARLFNSYPGVHKSEPIGSREHDNIVDRQLGDREWRAVHKMVVVRSHWPCRLRDRGRSHLVARIWRPTSPDVVPPLDRQFGGVREVRKVREVREQARILSRPKSGVVALLSAGAVPT